MKLGTPDGFELEAAFEPAGEERVVVMAHGMTVDMGDEGVFVEAEKKLNEAGVATVRFDFRAHGKSSGDPVSDFTISGEMVDLETVVEFLEGRGFRWIGLAGASFGGGIAALYAGRNPEKVSRLLLVNPVLDFKKAFLKPNTPWGRQYFTNVRERLAQESLITVGHSQMSLGKKLFEEMTKFRPCQALDQYPGSVLLLHGTQDTKISINDVEECVEGAENERIRMERIEGADHGFHEEPYGSKVIERIVDFFS